MTRKASELGESLLLMLGKEGKPKESNINENRLTESRLN